jgi:bis(5'-nucleosyl)-tetraphosphatase (symmetrical)
MISGSTAPESPPRAGAMPWFIAPQRASSGTPIVFGHWASLGLWIGGDVLALDSGCVWGGALSAVRLEDRAVFSVSAHR